MDAAFLYCWDAMVLRLIALVTVFSLSMISQLRELLKIDHPDIAELRKVRGRFSGIDPVDIASERIAESVPLLLLTSRDIFLIRMLLVFL